jgi:hypothetical protein
MPVLALAPGECKHPPGSNRSQPASTRQYVLDRESGKIPIQAGNRRRVLDGDRSKDGICHQVACRIMLGAEATQYGEVTLAWLDHDVMRLCDHCVDEIEDRTHRARDSEDSPAGRDAEDGRPNRPRHAEKALERYGLLQPGAHRVMCWMILTMCSHEDIHIQDDHAAHRNLSSSTPSSRSS